MSDDIENPWERLAKERGAMLDELHDAAERCLPGVDGAFPADEADEAAASVARIESAGAEIAELRGQAKAERTAIVRYIRRSCLGKSVREIADEIEAGARYDGEADSS